MRTFDEIKQLTEYFRSQGAVKFSVDDISVDFGPIPPRMNPGPGVLDDPEAMREANLEFIKQTLAEQDAAADELENWST